MNINLKFFRGVSLKYVIPVMLLLSGSCKIEPPPPPPPEPPQPVVANIGLKHLETPPLHCTAGTPGRLVNFGKGQFTAVVTGSTPAPPHNYDLLYYFRPDSGLGHPILTPLTTGTKPGISNYIMMGSSSGDPDRFVLSVPVSGAYNIATQFMEWSYAEPTGYGNTSSCNPAPSQCWKFSKVIGLASGTIPDFGNTGTPVISTDMVWFGGVGNCLIY